MNNNYYVYMHVRKTQSKNGIYKKYIGLTGKPPKVRWQNGTGYIKSSYFFNALKKHGWDGFEHKIIAHGLSKEEAQRLEAKLIKHYKTNIEDYGYNLTTGGEASSLNKSSRLKISKANSGKNNGMYGRCGSLSPKYGKPCPEYTKRMLSLKNKGNIPPNRKPVVCLETGEKYDCIFHVEKKYGISAGKSHIGEVCTGKRNEAIGRHWMFLNDYNKLTKDEIKTILFNSKCRFKRVIDLKTGNIYKSRVECAKHKNVSKEKVRQICMANYCNLDFMYYFDFYNLDEETKTIFKKKWSNNQEVVDFKFLI